jgi:hypothetical protein
LLRALAKASRVGVPPRRAAFARMPLALPHGAHLRWSLVKIARALAESMGAFLFARRPFSASNYSVRVLLSAWRPFCRRYFFARTPARSRSRPHRQDSCRVRSSHP